MGRLRVAPFFEVFSRRTIENQRLIKGKGQLSQIGSNPSYLQVKANLAVNLALTKLKVPLEPN
jgi:hypothetical protein